MVTPEKLAQYERWAREAGEDAVLVAAPDLLDFVAATRREAALREALTVRLPAFEDLARELVARWRDGVSYSGRSEAEIVDAFEVLLSEVPQ